jgi:hypothetical protein
VVVVAVVTAATVVVAVAVVALMILMDQYRFLPYLILILHIAISDGSS